MTPFAKYVHLLARLQERPDPKALAAQWKAEGVSIREIGRRLEVSRETARRYLAPPANPRTVHSKETKERYWELRRGGVSIRAAAREMGLSRGTVQWWEDEGKRA